MLLLINETSFLNLKEKIFKKKKFVSERCGIMVGKKICACILWLDSFIEDESPTEQSYASVFRTTSHVYDKLLGCRKEDQSMDYLGEWHTHSPLYSQASLIDHFTMLEMIDNPKFGKIEWVILLIIRSSDLKAYYYDKKQFIKEIGYNFV